MAACDTDSLIAQSLCFSECVNIGMQMPILISLAAQIAGVPLDPASLMANSQCFDKCIPDGDKLAVMVYLACQIAGGQGECVAPVAPVLSFDSPQTGFAAFNWTEAVDTQLDFLLVVTQVGGGVVLTQSFPPSSRTTGNLAGFLQGVQYSAVITARNSVACASANSNAVVFTLGPGP